MYSNNPHHERLDFFQPSSCTSEYEALGDSTMCAFHDASFTNAGVSEEDKVKIVNRHNEHRANVNPAASNMEKMVSKSYK